MKTRTKKISARSAGQLSRYTTLPVLIDLLRRKKLVLLSPDKWEDRNDAEVMLEYKRRKNLQHLYAVCFSKGDETIHHWSAFSSGSSGCCIEFDQEVLLSQVNNISGIRFGPVQYRKIQDLPREGIEVDQMPFTKRWPYRCEEEFRIIFESADTTASTDGFYDIDIDLKTIRKITINQRMPQQVYVTIKEYLKDAFRNPGQRISRSTLYENQRWISKFKKA
jgi:hypothetical protein